MRASVAISVKVQLVDVAFVSVLAVKDLPVSVRKANAIAIRPTVVARSVVAIVSG